jgi:FAD synthetase
MESLRIDRNLEGLEEAIDWAKRYYSDAKVFAKRSDHVSALTAIAYCEGILEALRLLGLVSFSWSPDLLRKNE